MTKIMNSNQKQFSKALLSNLIILLFISLCSFALAAPQSTPQDFSLETSQQINKLPIGMNLQPVNYFTSSPPFTDVMTTASEMMSYAHGTGVWDSKLMSSIPVDQNGWPTQIPYTVDGTPQDARFLFSNQYNGEYVVLYDGEGDISFGGIKPEYIDGIAHITLTGVKKNRWINITRSTSGNHIRNMRIIPVEFLNNESSMPVFREEYINALQPFHALRFMDIIRTNNSRQSLWVNRVTTTEYSQGTKDGIAWEYVIELCNITNTDMWICIPHLASDNYITQLATLIKNTLNPGLKVYLEFSNEMWNWMFKQANYILKNAPDHPNAYVSTDLAALAPAGKGHPEKDAYMMARAFRLFDAVYGADMNEKVIRVATGQLGWLANSYRIMDYLFTTDGIGADALSHTSYFGFDKTDHSEFYRRTSAVGTTTSAIFSTDIMKKGAQVGNILKVGTDGEERIVTSITTTTRTNDTANFDALSEAVGKSKSVSIGTTSGWVFQESGTVTPEMVIASIQGELTTEAFSEYEEAGQIAKDYGVINIQYEGGQHVMPLDQQEWPYNQAFYDAQIHSGMYDLYIQMLNKHTTPQVNSKLMMAYNLVGARESKFGSWGHLEDLSQLSAQDLKLIAPKFKALLDANAPK